MGRRPTLPQIQQFNQLLQPRVRLQDLPNINLAWASLLVEDLCRQGVSMFCIAPGKSLEPRLTLLVYIFFPRYIFFTQVYIFYPKILKPLSSCC